MNFLERLQHDTSSFLLFSVDISGLQIIKYFPHKHKLHFLVTLDRISLALFFAIYFAIYIHPSDAPTKKENELSKHIWTLKDAKKAIQIKWKVLKKCQPYNNISNKSNLCLHEKYIITC